MDCPGDVHIKVENTENSQNDALLEGDLIATSVLKDESKVDTYFTENNTDNDDQKGRHQHVLAIDNFDSLQNNSAQHIRSVSSAKADALTVLPYILKKGICYCSICDFKCKDKKRTLHHFKTIHKELIACFNNMTNKAFEITPSYQTTNTLSVPEEDVKPILIEGFSNLIDVREIFQIIKVEDNNQNQITLTKNINCAVEQIVHVNKPCAKARNITEGMLLNEDRNNPTTVLNMDNLNKCSYCSFTSVLKRNIKEHNIKMHSDKHQYHFCKLCDTYFSTILQKEKHVRRLHTEIKKVFCTQCKFSTVYSNSLKMHMQHHSGKLQLCYICGQRSTSEYHMDVHIRTHFGLKPYSCDVCDYKSSSLSRLSSHQYTHSTERSYSCDECIYRSKTKEQLNRHKQTHVLHKPIACKLCDYTCARNEFLNRHMRIHQLEERRFFECNTCSKQFSCRAILKRHEQTHLGLIFNCRFCSFTTNTVHSLHTHEGRHSELFRMHCFLCSYSSTNRANFTEHVNKTCAKARHKKEALKYWFYCSYSSNHRSNFVNHVTKCYTKQKEILNKKRGKKRKVAN